MDDAEDKYFSNLPDDFKEYMYKELNFWPLYLFSPSKYLYGGVFWSREDDEPQRPSTLPDGNISNLNKIIRHLLYTILHGWPDWGMLVQFWAPITTKEGRSFLTTRNQPFSLNAPFCVYEVIEGLCGYRMICMDSKFDIDLDGGTSLPGRVFKHQFPESTPNVEFYSITEYPQRDGALRCGVRQSLAFPVFESSTQTCVGVIEVVSPVEEKSLICNDLFRYRIYEDFEDLDKNEACEIALAEIKEVLQVVCEVHVYLWLMHGSHAGQAVCAWLWLMVASLVEQIYIGIAMWPPRMINEASCSQLNEFALCVDQEQTLQLNSDHLPSYI